jgi:hypothetical protein
MATGAEAYASEALTLLSVQGRTGGGGEGRSALKLLSDAPNCPGSEALRTLRTSFHSDLDLPPVATFSWWCVICDSM